MPRLVKERKNTVPVDNDLRGLDNELLTEQAGLEGQWIIRMDSDPISTQTLNKICLKYRLMRTAHPAKENTHVISAETRRPGEHKIQATTLFYSALEMFEGHKSCRSYLTIHSPFADRLARETRGKPFEDLNKNFQSPITLDPGVQHALHQAGVLAATSSEKTVGLTEAELKEIAKHLTAKNDSKDLHKRTA